MPSISESLAMRDAGDVGLRPLALDSGKRAAPQSHKFTVVGEDGAGIDQAAFYNLRSDVAESGATLVAPTPSAPGWTLAQVNRYIGDCPASLRNIHFSGASTNSLLENSTVRFVRCTPDVAEQTETIFLSTFVHDQRFQPTVLSVPVAGEILDGYTYVRILSPQAMESPNGYTVTFSFGAAPDRRGDIPVARGAVVAGPTAR
jgi:hypothetical protein